jgi:putative transposase
MDVKSIANKFLPGKGFYILCHQIAVKRIMPQTYTSIWVHLIWSTKNKEPLISKKLKYELLPKIREIAQDKGYWIDFLNCVEDHIHLLIILQPKYSISEIVKNIKGPSYHWVNNSGLITEHFNWQDGFSGFSVSPRDVQRVRNYIKNQEEHHKNKSIDDEMHDFEKMNENK